MSTITEKIGERIKQLRLQKGWSQGQVAKLCGWSGAPRLANYESGIRSVGADDAIVLAKVLGTTPSELLFGEPGDQSQWLNESQKKMLSLFNQLPDTEQQNMINMFEIRLKEIDEYVAKYLRGRYSPPEE